MSLFDGLNIDEETQEAIQGRLSEEFVAKDEFDKVKNNRDELLGEKKTEQEKRRESEQKAENERLEREKLAAEKSGDIEALNKSWEERLAAKDEEINSLRGNINKSTLGGLASDFVSAHVIKDNELAQEKVRDDFMNRLDMRDGKPVVLDTAGNLTSLSVDDLKNEFLANGKYKPFIVASNADGGGAGGSDKTDFSGADLSKKSLKDCKTKEERKAVLKSRMAGAS